MHYYICGHCGRQHGSKFLMERHVKRTHSHQHRRKPKGGHHSHGLLTRAQHEAPALLSEAFG